jgi:voltage-gated potassium channel
MPQYATRYATAFDWIEYFSLAVFTIEYALRLWVAVGHGPYRHLSHMRARLKYATSAAGVIDLIAVLPFWFAILLPSDFRFVLVFRMVRVLRGGGGAAPLAAVGNCNCAHPDQPVGSLL